MQLSVKLLFAPLQLRATEPEWREDCARWGNSLEAPPDKSEWLADVARFGAQVRLRRQWPTDKCSQWQMAWEVDNEKERPVWGDSRLSEHRSLRVTSCWGAEKSSRAVAHRTQTNSRIGRDNGICGTALSSYSIIVNGHHLDGTDWKNGGVEKDIFPVVDGADSISVASKKKTRGSTLSGIVFAVDNCSRNCCWENERTEVAISVVKWIAQTMPITAYLERAGKPVAMAHLKRLWKRSGQQESK